MPVETNNLNWLQNKECLSKHNPLCSEQNHSGYLHKPERQETQLLKTEANKLWLSFSDNNAVVIMRHKRTCTYTNTHTWQMVSKCTWDTEVAIQSCLLLQTFKNSWEPCMHEFFLAPMIWNLDMKSVALPERVFQQNFVPYFCHAHNALCHRGHPGEQTMSSGISKLAWGTGRMVNMEDKGGAWWRLGPLRMERVGLLAVAEP